MRRINLFSYGMMSLFKLAVRVLVIVLAVTLLRQAHPAQPAPSYPPRFDRCAMPETAIATPSSPEESSAAKPAPDWRFFVLEYHNFTDDPAQVTDYTITISGLRRDPRFSARQGIRNDPAARACRGQLDDGAPLPQKAVLLTFDDGYVSNFTLALPLLREYGAKAAVSLITARIDEGTSGFLSWDECREMAKSGLVEFASHTHDHHIHNDANGIERRNGESEDDYLTRISYDLETSITRIKLETGQPSPPSPTRSAKWNRGRSLFCSSSFPSRSPAFTARRATAIRSIICRASTSVIATPRANTCAALEMISFGVLVS